MMHPTFDPILAAVLVLAVALAGAVYVQASAEMPFEMPEVKPPSFPDRTFDVRDHGAVGDGETLNTKAFADAIKVCNQAGGGRVLVPAGDWLTGPVHLRSNVNLHLEKGAQLLFSTDFKHYLPPVFVRWQGMECLNYSPLVYAKDCKNIGITGEGTLNGQGEAWWPLNARKRPAAAKLYEMIRQGVPVKDRVFGTEEFPLRPSFVQPISCTNVLIEGVTVKNGPMWTVHPVYCENLLIRGITVNTEGPNTDGLVPDSCKNVIIEDCSFSTGDDCVVIKSGLDEDAWRVGRPSENIVVRRCRTARGHGAVVIGSEMSGGVKNVFVHDCTFDGTSRGIRMKSRRGRGGVVENIWVKDVAMGEISKEVIRVNMLYGGGAVQPRTSTAPAFRGIHVSGVTCKRAGRAVELIGLPEKPIENVTFADISIAAASGIHCTDVKGVRLLGVSVTVDEGPVVTLKDGVNVTITGSKCPKGAEVFLEVKGEKSSGIRLEKCDLSGAETAVLAGDEVPPDAVVQE